MGQELIETSGTFQMAVTEVVWLVLFIIACWFIYRWAVAILIWSLLGFLVIFHTHPQEMNRILQEYIIPTLEAVINYIHTQVRIDHEDDKFHLNVIKT